MDSARAGQKVAMIERSKIGGTCINVACIPTKTIINSGRVMKCALRATEFGITGVDNDLLGARAEKIGRNTDGTVTMSLATGNSVTADDILVAVGRDPVTDGINLEGVGVKLTERGFVRVDEYLRTTSNGVWAAGDVAGTPQFTHAA